MSNFLYRKKNRVRMTPPNLFSLFSVRLVLTIDQENTGVIRLFYRSGLIQVQFIRSNKIIVRSTYKQAHFHTEKKIEIKKGQTIE